MDDLVEQFMRTEAHKVDDAFAVSSVYDQQRAVFRKTEPVNELKQSMLEYVRLGFRPPLQFGPDDCTWDDILNLMISARRDYEAKASGLKGLFRKAWRKAGNNSTRIAPIFEMIPDDTGLSVLKGGLGWILTMARENAKKREAIFSAFESIPETFAMAVEKRKIFQQYGHVQQQVASLHGTIVHSIIVLISFLLPDRRVHLVLPFIKRIPTEKDVNSILSSVERKSQALNQYISHVTEAAIMDTQKLVSAFPEKLEKLEKGFQSIWEEVKLQRQSTVETHYKELSEKFAIEAQNAMQPLLGGLLKEFERGVEYLARKIQEDRTLKAIELCRATTPLHLTGTVGMTVGQFLHTLAIDPMGMTNDLQTVLRSREQLDHGTSPQTSLLLQNGRFKFWCSSIDPTLLLVDASMVDGGCMSKISPLSSACASIVASIIKVQPNAIPLFYFCGLHTFPQSPLQGPLGLLRTLVAGLLVELDGRSLANLSFIDTQSYRQALESHEISSLCHAFKRLIQQWPTDTVVYCVIDGIGWCDRAEWSADLIQILNVLYELVCDRRLRPIFKVLISSPMRSQTVSSAIRREDTIILGMEASPAREEFLPERYILLNETKAEFQQLGESEGVKDDDFYT